MLSEIAAWNPRALILLLAAAVVTVWLGLSCLYVLLRDATTWLLGKTPGPGARPVLNPHVPHPGFAARQAAGMAALLDLADPQAEGMAALLDLADPTRERVGCRCSFWDPEADRADWIPCEMHIDQLIKELLR